MQRGTNLDSPLHAAAQKDCISIVKLLLEFGADVNARNLENKRPVEAAPPGSLTEGFLLIYEGEINVQQHDRLKSHLCFDFYVFYCISLHQFCSFYSNTPFSATTVPSANQGEFGTFPTASFTTFAPP